MRHEIKHHLTEELMIGYSAGTLPEAVNLAVATHISMCDTCRAEMNAYDAVGGSLMDATKPAAINSGSLNAVLSHIHTNADASLPPIRRPGDTRLPAPLDAYVEGGLDAVKWRPVGLGVKQAVLKTSPDATARLLYIPAGTAVPDHGHNGLELTLVLQGAFSDEDGTFGPGDIEVASDDLEHTPVADISEDCICLAVTDAPLRFKGWLPRLAQPFVGI